MGLYYNSDKSTKYKGEWCVSPTYKYIEQFHPASIGEAYFQTLKSDSLKTMYKYLIVKYEAKIRIEKDYPNFVITFPNSSNAELFVKELESLITNQK